jgi:hypothetical protein
MKGFFIQGHPESAIFDNKGQKNFDEASRISEEILNESIFDAAKVHMLEREKKQVSLAVG